jgi:hypothetical protein
MTSAADEGIRSIGFLFTEDQFIAAYRAIRMTINESYDSPIMRLGVIIGGHVFLLGGICVLTLWATGARGQNGPIPLGAVIFNVIVAIVAAVVLCRTVYFYRRRLRSLYRSFPLRDEKVLYTLTPLRYSYQHRLAQGSVDWSLVPMVTELRDGFVIHTSTLEGHWIPRRAITEPLGDVEVANFLRSHVKKFKVINRFAGLARDTADKLLSSEPDYLQC